MKGMMMDAKKSGGMSKGAMGGKNKGGMGVMMSKNKKKDKGFDEFWGGVLGDLSMSMPAPTPSPTTASAVIPVPTKAPFAFPVPVPTPAPTDSPVASPVSTGSPTSAPVVTDFPTLAPAATALPTRAPVLLTTSPTVNPTEAPVIVTATPSEAPVTPTDTPSLSPFTVCNSKSRSDAFFSILQVVTSPFLLNDPDTPQGFAYEFLVSGDPAVVDPCTYPTVEQRYAAVALSRSTNGQDWTNPTGWLTAANECEWFGVRCNGNDLVTGLFLCK